MATVPTNSTDITERWEQELTAPSCDNLLHGEVPVGSDKTEKKILSNNGKFEILLQTEDENYGSPHIICQVNTNDVECSNNKQQLNNEECEQIECEELAPSSSRNVKLDEEKLELNDEWNNFKCNIDNKKWCNTYNIGTLKIPTQKKSWCWNKRRKKYCWKYQKINNYICKSRSGDSRAPEIATKNILEGDFGGQGEENNLQINKSCD